MLAMEGWSWSPKETMQLCNIWQSLKIYRENISHLEARHLGHLMRHIAIASLVHLLCWQSLRFRQVSNPHPASGVVSCRENMPFSPSSLVELFGRLPSPLVCALTIILVTYTFLRWSFAFASTSLKSAIWIVSSAREQSSSVDPSPTTKNKSRKPHFCVLVSVIPAGARIHFKRPKTKTQLYWLDLPFFFFFCQLSTNWSHLGRRNLKLRKISSSDWPVVKSIGAFSWLTINVGGLTPCGQCHLGKVVLEGRRKAEKCEPEEQAVSSSPRGPCFSSCL